MTARRAAARSRAGSKATARSRRSRRGCASCSTDGDVSRPVHDTEARLHAARPGTIEAELVAIALEATGAEHGALFVWDKEANGLALVHHVVNGVIVTLPRVVKHDGAKAGIALHVYD